jgi:hypothetical protein
MILLDPLPMPIAALIVLTPLIVIGALTAFVRDRYRRK